MQAEYLFGISLASLWYLADGVGEVLVVRPTKQRHAGRVDRVASSLQRGFTLSNLGRGEHAVRSALPIAAMRNAECLECRPQGGGYIYRLCPAGSVLDEVRPATAVRGD